MIDWDYDICEGCGGLLAKGTKCDDCRCTSCEGAGEVAVMVDSHGVIDFIDGHPSGEFQQCTYCSGTGIA